MSEFHSMKRIPAFLFICLLGSASLFAQAPQLQKFANGNALGASAYTINSTNRVTLKVDEGTAFVPGTVYEFGAIHAYRMVNGQRQLIRKFKDSEILNGPSMNLVVGSHYHPDLIGAFELEIEWIKRYDVNNAVTTLPLSQTDRTLFFNVQN